MDCRKSTTPASIGRFGAFVAQGCFDAIFEGSVLQLSRTGLLDTRVIHGDGTTTAALKGGDHLG